MDEDVLDALSEGVVLVEEGRVRRVNRAAAAFLGTGSTKVEGRPAIAVLRDHRIEQLGNVGERIELSLRGRRLEIERIAGGYALRDVSDVRRAEENARELLAVLSHELRTPVTTIRSTLDALAYGDLDDATRARWLERAVDETDRLVRLLDDLTIDVAPPQERSLELAPLADRASGLLAERFAEHDVTLQLSVPDVTVWADPDKVLQVLLNLLENAAVHGPDGATVQLRADDEGEHVVVRVRDEGTPLDAATGEGLFAPRARGSSTRAHGAGLGLYIVRSIAERAGGRAWTRPWTGSDGRPRGNEFAVELPARRRSLTTT